MIWAILAARRMDFSVQVLLILAVVLTVEGGFLPEGKCHFTTVHRMRAANCAAINLVNIPPAKRNYEILDASYNRIRMLKNDSFIGYSSLKLLYLRENSITFIETYAFEPLESLETLDLSTNAIRDLPVLLPSTLVRLYIAENPLLSVPLSRASSLASLNMSHCMFTDLPYLGELPNLLELDLSGNPLTNLTVTHIASFCSLQFIYLPHELFLDTRYLSNCDCSKLKRWIGHHSIVVHPYINCTLADNETDCAYNSSEEVKTFESCQIALKHQALGHWAMMAGGLAFIIICAIILIFFWRRRRVQHPQPHRTPDQEAAFRKRKLLEETPKSKF